MEKLNKDGFFINLNIKENLGLSSSGQVVWSDPCSIQAEAIALFSQ